ncbi:MAG: hypothetical protein DRQ46_07725, partial [Gammaproteobacteria bacterium]
MKKILGLMVVASLALTACDENAETSVNEEQVTSGVEEVVVVEEQVNEDKPSISASHSATVSALVEVINHETREVTLRKKDGSTVSFVASEEARNLDQVKVGDVLVVEYIETLDIQVMAVEDAKAEAAMAEMVARTKEGEMPGMAKM